MVSIEDAADTVLPEMLLDKEPDYDGWLFEKVSGTIRRVKDGKVEIHEHEDAMNRLHARLDGTGGTGTA